MLPQISYTAIQAENLLVREYLFNRFPHDDDGFRMFGKNNGKRDLLVVVYHNGQISMCDTETAQYKRTLDDLKSWLIANV